jgi:hypothetical protein
MRIVVAMDGSPHAEHVVLWVARWADRQGDAEITLINVGHIPHAPALGPGVERPPNLAFSPNGSNNRGPISSSTPRARSQRTPGKSRQRVASGTRPKRSSSSPRKSTRSLSCLAVGSRPDRWIGARKHKRASTPRRTLCGPDRPRNPSGRGNAFSRPCPDIAPVSAGGSRRRVGVLASQDGLVP